MHAPRKQVPPCRYLLSISNPSPRHTPSAFELPNIFHPSHLQASHLALVQTPPVFFEPAYTPANFSVGATNVSFPCASLVHCSGNAPLYFITPALRAPIQSAPNIQLKLFVFQVLLISAQLPMFATHVSLVQGLPAQDSVCQM